MQITVKDIKIKKKDQAAKEKSPIKKPHLKLKSSLPSHPSEVPPGLGHNYMTPISLGSVRQDRHTDPKDNSIYKASKEPVTEPRETRPQFSLDKEIGEKFRLL